MFSRSAPKMASVTNYFQPSKRKKLIIEHDAHTIEYVNCKYLKVTLLSKLGKVFALCALSHHTFGRA
jgi:hypothetical protein